MRSNKGFTLIELMIVVAIIAIIAAIAIPNLLRARLAANESSCIGSLRTLSSAQSSFQSSGTRDADSDGTGEYGVLAELMYYTPPFIDEVLGSGTKSGYNFYTELPATANETESLWWAYATPIATDRTGTRTFWVDESGVVRASDNDGVQPTRPGSGLYPIGFKPVGG